MIFETQRFDALGRARRNAVPGPRFYIKFAQFEQRQREMERAQARLRGVWRKIPQLRTSDIEGRRSQRFTIVDSITITSAVI